jgi:hypothetical protein
MVNALKAVKEVNESGFLEISIYSNDGKYSGIIMVVN